MSEAHPDPASTPAASPASEPGPAPSGSGLPDAVLLAALAEHDVPCPVCGYSLLGLLQPRCPECGTGLALRVNLAEPKLAAFITGLVPLCGALGFVTIVLVWGLSAGADWTDLIPLPIGAVVLLPLTVVWIRGRRWLLRRHAARLPLLSAMAWAVSAAPVVWFLMVVN